MWAVGPEPLLQDADGGFRVVRHAQDLCLVGILLVSNLPTFIETVGGEDVHCSRSRGRLVGTGL